MSKYINLDDPDVTYSHNAGNHEVYIVGSEAERIDLVRCGECKWYDNSYCFAARHNYYSPNWEINIRRKYKADFFCADGERREDG